MKKFVLSAVITGLLGPLAYAMDGGGAPPVEVELPAVVDVPVEIDLPAVVDLPAVEVEIPAIETPVVETPAVEEVVIPEFVALPCEREFPGREQGNPEVPFCPVGPGFGGEGTLPIDENGDPVECFLPGIQVMRLDENGLVVCEGVDPAPVDDNGDPVVFYSFSSAAGGELPSQAYSGLNNSTEDPSEAVDNRSEEGTAIRNIMSSGLLPNFRGGVSEREPELPEARSQGDAHAADPQLVNAGQRGLERSTEHRAERSLRAGDESPAPRTGIGRLFAKFHRSESEVTPASAPGIDKALTSQLAGIDRLRDTALRTGDQKLLARADKLEQELRARSGQGTRIPTRTK